MFLRIPLERTQISSQGQAFLKRVKTSFFKKAKKKTKKKQRRKINLAK
jgi:hypothetical protein